MAEKDKNLMQLFIEVDEAEPVPKSFADKDLMEAESGKGNLPKKVAVYKAILQKSQEKLNQSLQDLGVSVSGLKFKLSANSSVPIMLGYEEKNEKGSAAGKLLLNIDIQRELKYPSLESYARLYAILYHKVFENNKDKIKNNIINQPPKNDISLQKDEVERNSAKNLLVVYLKDFLPKSLNIEFEDFELNFVANQIADDLLNEMSPKEISNVSSYFFKMENLNKKALKSSKDYVNTFSSSSQISPADIENARMAKVAENVKNLALNENDDFTDKKALSAGEQFNALAQTFSGRTDKVKEALSGGFSNSNQNLINFCNEYASSFLESNGFKGNSVPLIFKNTGDCEYNPNGTIEINLSSKMFQGGNISELVMTLSHELTHAVDANINKVTTGKGLQGVMSKDEINRYYQDNSPSSPEAKNLLYNIQGYCYQLDPNERHGRMGEMSAIKFLQKIYEGDNFMQNQIKDSLQGYMRYQQKTINFAENLPTKIAEFETRFAALNLDPGSTEYKLISKRIEYLRGIEADFEKNGRTTMEINEMNNLTGKGNNQQNGQNGQNKVSNANEIGNEIDGLINE